MQTLNVLLKITTEYVITAFLQTQFDRKVGEAAVSSIIRNELLQCAKNKQDVIISDTNINKQLRHRLYQDLFDMGFEIRVTVFDC